MKLHHQIAAIVAATDQYTEHNKGYDSTHTQSHSRSCDDSSYVRKYAEVVHMEYT
jgi:hypothetical protein